MYGCDSLIELSVFVHPNSSAAIDTFFCSGESIVIGSQVFLIPGLYEILLPGASQYGCDSAIILTLTEIPLDTITITEEICEGDIITIGGSDFTKSGTYSLTAGLNQYGCDSIVTLILLVLPESISIASEEICIGDSIFIQDTIITLAGTYTFEAGVGMNGCDSTLFLVITEWINSPDTVHLEVCQGDMISIGGIEIIVDTSIIISDSLKPIDVCDSIITYIVTVIDTPKLDSVIIIPDNGSGTGAINPFFDDTSIVSWLWSNGASEPILSDAIAGIYILSLVNTFGCVSDFTFEVPLNTGIIEEEKVHGIRLIQNPISEGSSIQLQLNSSTDPILIDLIHSSGRIVQHWQHRSFQGLELIEHTPDTRLEPGVYIIHMKIGKESQILKLVVM